MNRRAFLASLPFLPLAAKVAVASPLPTLCLADESPLLYRANALGINTLLSACPPCSPLTFDDLMTELYKLKRERHEKARR
jgi:hypothetical protein